MIYKEMVAVKPKKIISIMTAAIFIAYALIIPECSMGISVINRPPEIRSSTPVEAEVTINISGGSVPDFTVDAIDPEAQDDDLIVDFGTGYGAWVYYNDTEWWNLITASAVSVTAADVDGSGQSDLIIDFGAGNGVWIYYNDTYWWQLNATSPVAITAADIDGSGQADIIVDFGAGNGLWAYTNDSAWKKLQDVGPELVGAGNVDGDLDNKADLIVDFGTDYGVWIYYNDTYWWQLNAASPAAVTTADIDGSGKADIVVDFGAGNGLWVYMNDGAWIQLNAASPEFVRAGNVDGDLDNKADLIVDFGTDYGVWIYYNDTYWWQLNAASPAAVTTADIDGSGKADIVVDFGAGNGLWIYMNDGSWKKLQDVSPASVTAAKLDGEAVSYLWEFDGEALSTTKTLLGSTYLPYATLGDHIVKVTVSDSVNAPVVNQWILHAVETGYTLNITAKNIVDNGVASNITFDNIPGDPYAPAQQYVEVQYVTNAANWKIWVYTRNDDADPVAMAGQFNGLLSSDKKNRVPLLWRAYPSVQPGGVPCRAATDVFTGTTMTWNFIKDLHDDDWTTANQPGNEYSVICFGGPAWAHLSDVPPSGGPRDPIDATFRVYLGGLFENAAAGTYGTTVYFELTHE